MKLIAFVGPKGSGKDTCAQIAKEAGAVAGKISFAGPLKRICADVFDIPLETFEDPVKKEEFGTYQITAARIGCIMELMGQYIPFDFYERDCMREFADHLNNYLNSPRQVLQYVGTDMIRAYSYGWHLKAAFSTKGLEEAGAVPGQTYAVTDCRFLNEYFLLNSEHETEFFYVERPEAEAQLNAATHVSEREVKEVRKLITQIIPNTGTMQGLQDAVLAIL